ncbi:ABC transporter substrate-binding protein [Bradyrhizobium sp. 187]|nr:ABC transporter substrate-binding protein [Bradyrhizobium sp. 187]
MGSWLRAAIVGVICMWSAAAAAEGRIKIGCTGSTDCASAVVAAKEGIFKKNGLDAEMVLIGLASNIPAALVSNSIQIGGLTPPMLLQADDGGLDLVALAGASSTAKETVGTIGVIAKRELPIKVASDFVGKKVGAPGLGVFLDVLFRQWLIQKGVDPSKVSFVEVTFATMNDLLKTGTLDAVIASEPTLSRISGPEGAGTVVANFMSDFPEKQTVVVYSATRQWAAANPKEVAAYRKSIVEAAEIVNRDPDNARQAMSEFTKVSMDILKSVRLSVSDPAITTEQLGWWMDIMKQQKRLQNITSGAGIVLQ